MMKQFDGSAGEFPPVKIGQFIMADNGIKPADLTKMDEVYAKCETLDEQVAVLFDHPEVVGKIFLGSLISRRDDYITLKDVDPKAEATRDFPFNKVMAVFGLINPDNINTTILSPEHLNSFIAKTWMNVRWPRAE